MQTDSYDLPVHGEGVRWSTTAWLMLGVAALIAAGIFSILLVLARAPGISSWIPFIDFFHVGLVVHVTLSVLIWLLSLSAAMWSLSSERGARLRLLRSSFWVHKYCWVR